MDLKEHLNPKQLDAALHIDGPMLVVAGAGSGKTRLITFRIVHLLDIGVPSSEILAVTFTNKAAEEMRKRVHALAKALVLTSTFHSLGARILRQSIDYLGYGQDFAIFDEEDSEKLLKQCLADKNIKDEKGLLKTIKTQISGCKNQLLEPNDIAAEDPLISEIYANYQTRLKQYNAVDFDDLLFLPTKLFHQNPEVLSAYQNKWTFFLIDEYQDTNFSQHALIKLLAAPKNNVFAVGDPDQSIYSWRGASINNILNFEKDFPEAQKITLDQNYRSKSTILNAANALIEHNTGRFEKNLWSNRGEGEKIEIYLCDKEQEEVAFVINRLLKHYEKELIPLSECALFYRTHFQSRSFEDGFLRARIPYKIIGGLSFYMRKEIKDILSLLRMAISGQDFVSFSRTIKLGKRGIGESTLAAMRLLSEQNPQDLLVLSQDILDKKIPFKLTSKQSEGLKDYLEMMRNLKIQIKKGLALPIILREAIELSHYYEILKEDPETFQERRENIEELISKAYEWEEETENSSLNKFLEELSLKQSHEGTDPSKDALSMMTLHNAKGLEFKVVFIVGMEEELFPHANALGDFSALEEERRLCYVGMTRAKDVLYLSSAKMRYLWGNLRQMRPSRFLAEIPEEYIKRLRSSFGSSSFSEEEFVEDTSAFFPGDFVLHKEFGKGIVKKSYNTSLGLTYDVYFPEADSLRTLVAKYAKLKTAKMMD